MTEQEKRDLGLWYDANYDPSILQEREHADMLCFQLNNTPPNQTQKRQELLRTLMPKLGQSAVILSPFYTDYGYHCTIGEDSFLNHGAHLMDCAPITIGSHCFIGPNCGMYTAIHPLLPDERNQGLECAKPITLGDNVWLGGDVTILPGVTIGSGSVIGAGSVVTKDIPAGVLAYGNPCRVIRPLTEQDHIANSKRAARRLLFCYLR